MNVDFEYAIKKDVRNNPIVREVDSERQRQLWKSLGIGGLLVLVVLFSAPELRAAPARVSAAAAAGAERRLSKKSTATFVSSSRPFGRRSGSRA